jgi:hypothetical protein
VQRSDAVLPAKPLRGYGLPAVATWWLTACSSGDDLMTVSRARRPAHRASAEGQPLSVAPGPLQSGKLDVSPAQRAYLVAWPRRASAVQ